MLVRCKHNTVTHNVLEEIPVDLGNVLLGAFAVTVLKDLMTTIFATLQVLAAVVHVLRHPLLAVEAGELAVVVVGAQVVTMLSVG
ncbi:MAG: hypothetical protein JNK26_03820 [Candidatus Doudnabacteria bacterium]|nr:hypothetical protein [Candidatus Doudnabacteria bacterium]